MGNCQRPFSRFSHDPGLKSLHDLAVRGRVTRRWMWGSMEMKSASAALAGEICKGAPPLLLRSGYLHDGLQCRANKHDRHANVNGTADFRANQVQIGDNRHGCHAVFSVCTKNEGIATRCKSHQKRFCDPGRGSDRQHNAGPEWGRSVVQERYNRKAWPCGK